MSTNPGWFKKGTDPRRHTFTKDECRKGGKAAFARLWRTNPRHARWILENQIRDPEQGAKTHQAIQDLIQRKLAQSDAPAPQTEHPDCPEDLPF
jgi:hypothetical protein